MSFSVIPSGSSERRYVVCFSTVLLVLLLTAVGRPPPGEVLTFLGGLVSAFLGISQWGNVVRAKAPQPPVDPP